jgi:hypothetical protein
MEINKNLKTEDFFTTIKDTLISLELLKDINGFLVIQKIITRLPELTDYIYEIIYTNFITIVTNKHGCYSLQKCIELGDKNQKQILIEKIINNSILLISDQFGNYIIQYLISQQDQILISKIISSFINNIEYLSKQKYSSNVIEKVKFFFSYSYSYSFL